MKNRLISVYKQKHKMSLMFDIRCYFKDKHYMQNNYNKLSLISWLNSFFPQVLYHHVFCRLAMVLTKEKVTKTICNENFLYPFVYRIPMPSYIWNDI